MQENISFRCDLRRIRPPTKGSSREGPGIIGLTSAAASSYFTTQKPWMRQNDLLPELVKRRWGEQTIRNDLTWLKQAEAMADWEFKILPPVLPPGKYAPKVNAQAMKDRALQSVIPEIHARDWINHTCAVHIVNKQSRDKDIWRKGEIVPVKGITRKLCLIAPCLLF